MDKDTDIDDSLNEVTPDGTIMLIPRILNKDKQTNNPQCQTWKTLLDLLVKDIQKAPHTI